jgi:hypothetical protein
MDVLNGLPGLCPRAATRSTLAVSDAAPSRLQKPTRAVDGDRSLLSAVRLERHAVG